MKYFNYTEVTTRAQEAIESFVKRALDTNSKNQRKMYLDQAYGVYYGWYWLTLNNQAEGDDARLQELIFSTQESLKRVL